MANLNIHPLTRAGVAVSGGAPSGGVDTFDNTGQEFLYLRNDSAGDVNVTITTHGAVDGLAIPDRTVTLPAGAARLVGPFPTAVYNDAQGRVSLSFDSATDVYCQVFRLVRGQ